MRQSLVGSSRGAGEPPRQGVAFRRCQSTVVDERTVRSAAVPRRHAALIDDFGDHRRVLLQLRFVEQRERRFPGRSMAFLAMPLQQRRHIAREGRHHRSDRGHFPDRDPAPADHRLGNGNRLLREHFVERLLQVVARRLVALAGVAELVVDATAVDEAPLTIEHQRRRGAIDACRAGERAVEVLAEDRRRSVQHDLTRRIHEMVARADVHHQHHDAAHRVVLRQLAEPRQQPSGDRALDRREEHHRRLRGVQLDEPAPLPTLVDERCIEDSTEAAAERRRDRLRGGCGQGRIRLRRQFCAHPQDRSRRKAGEQRGRAHGRQASRTTVRTSSPAPWHCIAVDDDLGSAVPMHSGCAEPAAALPQLVAAAAALRRREHAHLADLLAACRRSVAATAATWVEASVAAKGWQAVPAACAEEWASGPLPVARFLHLLHDLHRNLAGGRLPQLHRLAQHASAGAPSWSALPAPGLQDPLLLAGYRATLVGDETTQQHEPARRGGVALVLGAGNVTATPLLDVLHQVFLEGRAVLLKLSPLHRDLTPHLTGALAPLVEANLLVLCHGDATLGQHLAHEAAIAAVHLTGSSSTWEQLRGDPGLQQKHLTAEVGCCTPAVIVPGVWRTSELRHTAHQLAAFVAMNGGATCLAPRVLVTARSWPQRAEFLQHLREALAAHPARTPFHPTTRGHFERVLGAGSPTADLSPTLGIELELPRDEVLLRSEPFAPVLRELPLDGDDARSWLDRATNCVRDRFFGALSAYVCVPPTLRGQHRQAIDAAIARLPHGTVALNTWTGLGFGLGTTPWGAPPGASPEHGAGWTRGTLCLQPVHRTVLEAPFRPRPLPPWLPAHRRSEATLRALCQFYLGRSPWRLLKTIALGLSNL